MLIEKDMATLTEKLQVPLIIQDILDKREELTGDTEYGLHEILSDHQPDSALLAIALSAHKIAARHQTLNASLVILKMEAMHIIDDYADLWLRNAKGRPLDDNIVFETLAGLPDDLEALSEILNVALAFLQIRAPEAAKLCKILMIQAQNQALIAETFVALIDQEEEEATIDTLAANDLDMPPIACAPAFHSDNIIPFPAITN